MKNKLLTTTAIAGIAFAGLNSVSVAQTTVTGNLDLTYKAISGKGSSSKVNNVRGFGKETQINLTNKGKLSNGMDYVAGFSIEHDGAELGTLSNTTTSGSAMFNENVYIDFISGKTTFTIGADHIQGPDYEITNIAGIGDLDEIVGGINNTAANFITNIGSPYSSFGFGVTQDLGIGKASIYYSPSAAARAGDSAGGFGDHATYVDATNSVYEIGFRGNLGVKGLDAGLWYNNTAANDKGTNGSSLGNYKATLRYTTGPITAAAALAEQEAARTSTSLGGASSNNTRKSKSIGLGYALDKNTSVGLAHGRTTFDDTQATKDNGEKITTLSVGYSLGPVATGVSVGKATNLRNVKGQDGSAAMLHFNTRF